MTNPTQEEVRKLVESLIRSSGDPLHAAVTRCGHCDEVRRDRDDLIKAWESLGTTEPYTPKGVLFAYRTIAAKYSNEALLHARTKRRLDKFKDLAEAAEAFMDSPCACAVLQDQGAICRVCLLKERFAVIAL